VFHLARQGGCNLAELRRKHRCGASTSTSGGAGGGSGGGTAEGAPAGGNDAPPVKALADFFAHRISHRYIFAPTGDEWPAASVNAHVGAVPGPDDKPIPAAAWLDLRRAVEQRTWAPGEPADIRHRLITDGGWQARPGARVYNEYRPPTIGWRRGGDAQRWLDHVHRSTRTRRTTWCAGWPRGSRTPR
jgi:hypothetical protein